MMDKKIYSQVDFMNLTSDDIDEVKKMLNIEIPKEMDERAYLYGLMDTIEDNIQANDIISNKVLAGQTTVKWFQFKYNDKFTKEFLIDKLQNHENGYNQSIISRTSHIDSITCVVNNSNIYTLKILINDGYLIVPNGINTSRIPKIRSVVVKIDINNLWVEIRCIENKCNKIKLILSKYLALNNLEETNILYKYGGDVNRFKNSLINGFYTTYTAMPSDPIELTDADKNAVALIIKNIDEYLQDKDANKLIEALNNMNYDTEELSIMSILLAGIDKLGMGIKDGCKKDMSDQSFYNIIKDYIIENSSFIKFAIKSNGALYTMQLGLKSNNIRFMTSVTEDVINYIREKVL